MSSPGEYYGFTPDVENVIKELVVSEQSPNATLKKKESHRRVSPVPVKIKKKDDNRKYLGQIIHQQHSIITTLSELTEKVSKIEKYIILRPLMDQISNSIAFEKVKKEYEDILSSISKIVKKD